MLQPQQQQQQQKSKQKNLTKIKTINSQTELKDLINEMKKILKIK